MSLLLVILLVFVHGLNHLSSNPSCSTLDNSNPVWRRLDSRMDDLAPETKT